MEDWKFRARDKLRDYPARLNALETIPLEIKALQLKMEAIRSATSDSTPVQGGGSTREDAMLNNIAERGELENALEITKLYAETMNSALAILDADEFRVLELFYIQPQAHKIERLMDELHLADERSVYKRLDRALSKFTLAYYGVEKL